MGVRRVEAPRLSANREEEGHNDDDDNDSQGEEDERVIDEIANRYPDHQIVDGSDDNDNDGDSLFAHSLDTQEREQVDNFFGNDNVDFGGVDGWDEHTPVFPDGNGDVAEKIQSQSPSTSASVTLSRSSPFGRSILPFG